MKWSISGSSLAVVKKVIAMTAALATLTGSAALADGMNLAWQTCRTSANNWLRATNDFTPLMPCDDGSAPWTTRRIVMSFTNTTPMIGWRGTTVYLDVYVDGRELPDFWSFGTGGCSDGMVAGANTMINGADCINPYTLEPTDPWGQADMPSLTVNASSNRLFYRADHVRLSLGVNLPVPTSPGGYTANQLALQYGYSDGSIAACAGCDVPACFILNRIDYYSPYELRTIMSPELRTRITWASRHFDYAACPGVVTAASSTWGQVKALYR